MALYIMIRKIADHPTSAEYVFGTGEDRLGQFKIDKTTGQVVLVEPAPDDNEGAVYHRATYKIKIGIQGLHDRLGTMSVSQLDYQLHAHVSLRTGTLVGAHDLTQVFRIKLAGEAGGLHQIAEQDGELAAFRLGGIRCLGG